MPPAIVIAEDDPNIVLSLEFLLRQAGYDVRAVNDGEAALAAVRQAPPDLVLLDVMMPKLGGFEVCRRRHADGEEPRSGAGRRHRSGCRCLCDQALLHPRHGAADRRSAGEAEALTMRGGERLIGLFLFGAVLLAPPLLMLPAGTTVFGWPGAYVYLHGIWIVLVALIAWFTRHGSANEDGEDAS
jgi:hypothetical protein